MSAVRALDLYVDSAHPLQRANNVLALLVAANQPFYPLYVRGFAGPDGGVTFLTLLTTPLFLAVPALSRGAPGYAIASVPVIGLLNAAIATIALGRSVGIELFIVPCLAVAALVTDKSNAKVVLPGALAALMVFLLVYAADPGPLHRFDESARAVVYRLNAICVASLTIYILVAFSIARWRRQ